MPTKTLSWARTRVIERAELGGAVVHVGGGHGELGGGKQWSRTGSKEACLANHGSILARRAIA